MTPKSGGFVGILKHLVRSIGLAGLFLALLASAARAQEVIELGELKLGGTACLLPTGQEIPVSIDFDELVIPAVMAVKKDATQSLVRGTCSFALPLKLKSSHRLVLAAAKGSGTVNLAKGAQSQIRLEVFASGSKGEVLQSTELAEHKKLKKRISLESKQSVLVLGCGEAGILRGNASILVRGQSGRSTANIDQIRLMATLEECVE